MFKLKNSYLIFDFRVERKVENKAILLAKYFRVESS